MGAEINSKSLSKEGSEGSEGSKNRHKEANKDVRFRCPKHHRVSAAAAGRSTKYIQDTRATSVTVPLFGSHNEP